MQENDENQDYMKRNEEGELVPDYDQTIKIFEEGDVVSGKVVKIDRDEVLVDIGYKSEGVIPIRELSIVSNVDPHEVVEVGEEIDALVLQKEDNEGRLILSKKRAEFEKAWDRIEELCKEGSTIKGKAIEVVKGGLIVDIGLRGFLPASLVDLRRVKDLTEYVGQEMECKVIELNRARNNVVLSRRAVLESERKAEKQKLLSKLQKGQVLTGTVSSLVDFGAFVDLGGIDGLIHISELSWTHIDQPSEVVSIGDEVKVQVLDVDVDRERISLGFKQTQEDPWREKVKKFSAGDVVEGKVTKIVPFGAFVQMTEGVEALVHISELAKEHVESPEQVVKVGDAVRAKIVDIDLDRRRVSLSIKKLLEEEQVEESAEEAEVQEEIAAEEMQVAEEEKVEAAEETEEEKEVAAEAEEPAAEEAVEEIPETPETSEEPEEQRQEEVAAEEVAKSEDEDVEQEEPSSEPESGVSKQEDEKVEEKKLQQDDEEKPAAEIEAPELVEVETRFEEIREPSSLEAILEQMKEEKSQGKKPPVN